MNILFVSISWPVRGERNLYSDLMDEFRTHGHNVYVLAADNNIKATCLDSENMIDILRVRTSRIRKAGKIRKAIAFLNLGSKLRKEMLRFWNDIHIDLIISHSPPTVLSGFLEFLKDKFTAPLYYLLKDIWPQGPADLGLIKKKGIVYRYFRLHEIKMYKTADFIGCMSPFNVRYILKNNSFLTENKVEVCPNTIKPRNLDVKADRDEVRRKYNISADSTVFIFSGNIGKAHGLNFYLDAIETLETGIQAHFLIGGGGMYFNYVMREKERRGLKNLCIYQRLPSEEFDQLLLSSDVGVILLDSKYTVPQFPSRLLAYLEAGKPVLCSVNKATDIGKVVEDGCCGISTLHGDIESFCNAVRFFCDKNNTSAVGTMKVNSRSLLVKNYTTAVSYSIIMKHFS